MLLFFSQVVAGSSPGSFSLPKLNPPSTQTQPTPIVSSLTDSSSITFSIPVPNSCTNYSTGNSNHLENLLESPAEAISVISTKLKNTIRNAHGARKMIKRVYRPVSKAKPGIETVSQVLQPSETADFQPCIMLDGTEQYSIQGSNQIVDLTGMSQSLRGGGGGGNENGTLRGKIFHPSSILPKTLISYDPTQNIGFEYMEPKKVRS